MPLPPAYVLGSLYGLSEFSLSMLKRADRSSSSLADRGSLRLLWVTIGCGIFASYLAARFLPVGRLPAALYPYGFALFVAGLLLRWGAILYLGRFFTVNVAIVEGHRVVDTGPYAFIRHPSYTGALVAFLGYGLCLLNLGAVLVLVVPITIAFLRRIEIEEAALVAGLGPDYATYLKRTKRLIPFVY